jgi:hypothetical protein
VDTAIDRDSNGVMHMEVNFTGTSDQLDAFKRNSRTAVEARAGDGPAIRDYTGSGVGNVPDESSSSSSSSGKVGLSMPVNTMGKLVWTSGKVGLRMPVNTLEKLAWASGRRRADCLLCCCTSFRLTCNIAGKKVVWASGGRRADCLLCCCNSFRITCQMAGKVVWASGGRRAECSLCCCNSFCNTCQMAGEDCLGRWGKAG